MLLKNTATAVTQKPESTKSTESIFTAQMSMAAPTKVGGREVQVVPQTLNQDQVKSDVNFAKSLATTGTVGKNSLVLNQIDKVLASNSPLMKRARDSAALASAERGLNNTSMAVQAGEEAAISNALPIAQQDASTHANMDLANLNAQNQFASQGLGQAYTQLNQRNEQAFTAKENETNREFQTSERESSQNFQSSESAAERNARLESERLQRDFTAEQSRLADERQLSGQSQLSAQNFEQSKSLQELDAKNNLAMEEIRFSYQQTLNSSTTAQAIYQNHAQSVANIMSQQGITPSQAAAALKILNQTTKDNLALAGALNGVDLSAFAPTSSISGSSVWDKKSKSTINTFEFAENAQGAQKGQARADWLQEKVAVTLPGASGKTNMTREEAIRLGLIKDDYQG